MTGRSLFNGLKIMIDDKVIISYDELSDENLELFDCFASVCDDRQRHRNDLQGPPDARTAPASSLTTNEPTDQKTTSKNETKISFPEELAAITANREAMYGKREIVFRSCGRIVQAILEQAWKMKLPEISPRIAALIHVAIKLPRMANEGVYTDDTAKDLINYVLLSESVDPRNPNNILENKEAL